MAETHDLAKQDYLSGMKYQEIADKYRVSINTVKSWQKRHGWKRKEKGAPEAEKGCTQNVERVHPKPKRGAPKGNQHAKGHGAPKNNKNAQGHGAPPCNQNAVGNRGGPGGPPGNKKAVTTGEFETIWAGCMTEEELALCQSINTDTMSLVEHDLKIITLREIRMLKRIQDVTNGLTEKGRKVLQELREERRPIEIYDESKAQTKTIVVGVPKMVVTEITETERCKIDDILKHEEALTRVQEKKAKLLALKHNIELSAQNAEKQQLELEKLRAELAKIREDNGGNDSAGVDNFKEALMGKVPEVWGNGS